MYEGKIEEERRVKKTKVTVQMPPKPNNGAPAPLFGLGGI